MKKLMRILNSRRFVLMGLSGLAYVFLVACAVLTTKVYFQLDEFRGTDTDNISFSVSRMELEYTRLDRALHDVTMHGEAADQAAINNLRRTFNAFYSRTTLLRESPVYAEALVGPTDEALRTIEDTLERMVPLIDAPDQELVRAGDKLKGLVDRLTDPVTEMVRAGLALNGQRAEAQRSLLTTRLVELAILSILMVGTMVALIVQIWRLYVRFKQRAKDNRSTLRRVSTILNTSSDTILVVDGRNRIMESNATAVAVFGLNKQGADRDGIDSFLRQRRPDGTTRPITGAEMIEACRRGSIRRTDLIARDRYSRSFPVEMSADLAQQDGREVCVCYLRDISNRLEAEAQMEAARDRALAGEQAQARFLGMISHEMRTPLNGILGTLELMQETQMSPDQAQYVRIIRNAGQQLLTQINDALDLTQVGAGEISLHVAPFDLDELLDEALAGFAPLAESKGLGLTRRAAAEPFGEVMGDRARVLQVLTNLLSNAVKYTDEGDITLDAVRSGPGKDCIEMQVIDTGQGIATSDMPRIFDDFVRVGRAAEAEVPGTGLGLGIVRELVTLMGGKLGAESIPGEGSLFWVRLSLPRAPLETARSDAPVLEVPTEPVSEPSVAAPMHVLVVDDNEPNRFVLGEMLRKDGHRVTLAQNGVDAVEAAACEAFDLILMDIRMPRKDGITAAHEIRAMNGPSSEARLVFLTANIDHNAPKRFGELNAEAVLAKPFQRQTLRDIIAGRFDDNTALFAAKKASGGAVNDAVLRQLRDTLRPPTFDQMLGRFLNEGDTFIAALPELRRGEDDALVHMLHRFAGSAATFGATHLQETLGHAEAALMSGRHEEAMARLAVLPGIWAETAAAAARHKSAA